MLLFVPLMSIVSAASPEPALLPPEGGSIAGVAVALTFRPGPGALVSIDGCSAVELERQEGDRWVPARSSVTCDGAAVALLVPAELVLTVASPAAGTFRGVVAWGTGCVAGRSFGRAACRARGVARSEAFTVAAPPPVPAQR
jgi:hypothetical protein